MPERVDDPSIADYELLWRRIPNVPSMIKWNHDGTFRLTSAAFKDGNNGEVSVHLAKLTTQERALTSKPDNGLVEIEAGFPRSLGHKIVYDPTEDDISHTLICPPQGVSNKSRERDAREMAGKVRWLVYSEMVRK